MTMTNPTGTSEPLSSTELQTLLDDAPTRVWWRRTMVWVIIAVLALAGGATYFWQSSQKNNEAPVYVTEPVGRGPRVQPEREAV